MYPREPSPWWALAITLGWTIVCLVVVYMLAGCSSSPTPRQGASTAQQSQPRVDAQGARAPVTTETMQKSQQRQQESSVETGGKTGNVSSMRYGLDEGMQRTLAGYTEVVGRVLMSVAGTVGIATVGLLLMMIFLDAPANPLAKTIGVYVGLAVMVGGPIAIWLIW